MPDSNHQRIFISYSHRGRGPEWRDALLRALHVFEKHHLLDVWQDGKIRVSAYWDDDIKRAMDGAQLAVILLTKEALESEFILNTEFLRLRDRQRDDSLPVIPVICEDCEWRAHDWLRATQAPNASNPLAQLPDDDARDRVFRKLATDIAVKLSRKALDQSPKAEHSLPADRVYLEKFPIARGPGLREEKLIGREQELALLDLAFAQPRTAVVSLVAWGGVGKTMLVQEWLRRLERENWSGVQRIYAWSFFSQGTKEDRQASEDFFLAHALEWFGVKCEPTLSPWDKGRHLADAVAAERTLLVLDGIEPLQYPPGPMGGQLRAPGVQSLLKHLARKANAADLHSLCLVTTREALTDLADFQRGEGSSWGSVLRVDLGNLTEEAGAALLHHAGAKRAGAAEIKSNDKELLDASREVDGHALTLSLLGRFLARAHGGDIRLRDLVKFERADCKIQGGTTFKMLAAFEIWFAKSGEFGARQLAILRILGLFDRPAEPGCVAELRRSPVIEGLTDALFELRRIAGGREIVEQPLVDEDWNTAASFLEDFGLVIRREAAPTRLRGYTKRVADDFLSQNRTDVEIIPELPAPQDFETELNRGEGLQFETHPLIREFFSAKLLLDSRSSWEAAHLRLYRYLEKKAPYWPVGMDGLAPLYQAITHGCAADWHDEALRLFRTRILRGTNGPAQRYSTNILGAFGENLAALTLFFDIPWRHVNEKLESHDQDWVRSEVLGELRNLGRAQDALEGSREELPIDVLLGNSRNSAISANNLVQLELLAGNVAVAIATAERTVVLANEGQKEFQRVLNRATQAHALHCGGFRAESLDVFLEAERLQHSFGWDNPFLFSIGGYFFCDFLLSDTEGATWKRILKGDRHGFRSSHRVRRVVYRGCGEIFTAKKESTALGGLVRILWARLFKDDGLRSRLTFGIVGGAACGRGKRRARLNLIIDQMFKLDILSPSLDHLILGRVALFQAGNAKLPFSRRHHFRVARPHITTALEGLRASGQEWLVYGLLVSVWLHYLDRDTAIARDDLNEAWDIAERGSMRLHMADIHLYRARLFFREKHYPWKSPEDDLAAAEKLINECGYHRRDEELADAKRAILGIGA